MKKILVICLMLSMAFSYSQSVEEILKEKIQPRKTTETIKEGLDELKKICALKQEEGCDKVQAIALYLIADDYYNAAYQVVMVEPELSIPILKKAIEYYKEAESLKPISEFTARQKFLLGSGKKNFEDFIDPKLLLEN